MGTACLQSVQTSFGIPINKDHMFTFKLLGEHKKKVWTKHGKKRKAFKMLKPYYFFLIYYHKMTIKALFLKLLGKLGFFNNNNEFCYN